ncbi:MAG: GHMP kinase [Deltaproteobacteria bacterium]|nr:GHMP kinase [Deltaproteobacteria bacterium]
MIISQTPYRVSLGGGGTDLPAFYQHEPGAVLSVTLSQHMYVTVSPRFDRTIRVSYTRTDIADGIDAVAHTIVREALRRTDLSQHIEITTIGDVPAGTGMGSSSSLAVGVLNALYAYRGEVISARKLAEQACEIEIDVLGKPIGKQDQYAAAFGGLNYIEFNADGSVDIEPVPCRPETLRQLEERVLMFYTGAQRDADSILQKQTEGTAERMPTLCKMRDLAGEMRQVISGEGDLDHLAELLHEGWLLKRSLGFGISDEQCDAWYEAARKAGAQGGKLLGAGGGGFLMLVAPADRHDAIREALDHPRELEFAVDRLGSRIIFISDRY